MKKTIIVLSLVTISVLAYWGLSDKSIRISQQQIQQKLEQKMPVKKTFLYVLDVVLEKPFILLDDKSQRVELMFDILLQAELLDDLGPYRGNIILSGEFDYRADQQQLFLGNASVESFSFDGMPSRYEGKVSSLLEKALGRHFEKTPIYSLDQGQSRWLTAGKSLKTVAIQDKAVVLTVGL
ncbi:DUF1439 domain-containing protein [Pleionea sp. CnH1-48]|uniref:DUF1439 domain-containing protein n=1 Tax=Pleionea sp. CnH1-48 TaxID=2954494 RepID=UPI002098021A|nr:DUF1439 domain-containing protein [Pleionea sp. CnH1-48]MCO7224067.1 DUF1439 domain-containing protein [Pleionea sp. CnH1-48]